jgi:CspA family cold shock protein
MFSNQKGRPAPATIKERNLEGSVKFFNVEKGFGFIKADGNSEEYFVHISGVNGQDIAQEDRVRFDVVEDKKGPKAINVEKI